jgi:hypothetical protein
LPDSWVGKRQPGFLGEFGQEYLSVLQMWGGGNQLNLLASASKKTLYEAAIDLCQRLGRDVPWLDTGQRRGTRKG